MSRKQVQGRSPTNRVRPRLELLEDRLTPVTWPVTAPKGLDVHQMYNGYGAGLNGGFGFHPGIDILVDGKGGADEKVVAARAGEIVRLSPDYVQGARLVVKVDIGEGVFEYDDYLHIDLNPALKLNQKVAEGAELGNIATKYDEGRRHLHFGVLEDLPPANDYDEKNFMNPFLRFVEDADKDPLGKTPELFDTDGDKATLVIAKSGTAAAIKQQTIDGDVDMIADIRDQMNDTLKPITNPYIAGYWVKPLFDQGAAAPMAHGVKTAAKPYVLAKFDDFWFDGTNDMPPVATSTLHNVVYDMTRPAKLGKPHLDRFNNMIVTNTNGTTGSINNVKADQYWNTDAKDDGSADDVAHANFADKPNAGKNAEARFKDGDYEVHVTMSDVVRSTDKKAGKLRVVNFTRTADVDNGGQASSQGLNGILYSPSDAPWVPDFNPTPQIAGISKIFWLGDTVGVKGTEYYPGIAMSAFIEPHKAAGWNDGDDLEAGRIAWTIVDSDGGGSVPLTETWVANQFGKFDVIIDYDNDGKFSWKLDGLNGFAVLPKIIIGNWVWGDINPEGPNGIQDPNELWGSPGITVNLYLRDGTFVASTVTGNNGYYSFEIPEETPQWYYLEFVKPIGAYFSPKDTGPDDKDSDADPNTGLTDPFPSPQFYGELVDDTRDCGMYAFTAFRASTNDLSDSSPPPATGPGGSTTSTRSMDLASDVLTQVGQVSTVITLSKPSSAFTLDTADATQTIQPDDSNSTTARIVAGANEGIDAGTAYLDDLANTLVAVITGSQPFGSDQFLSGDPLRDRVGHTGTAL